MEPFTYAPPRNSEDDLLAFAAILGLAFNSPTENSRAWLDNGPHANIRLARDPATDAIVGGLVLVPMGQYFDNAAVPMTGIAGVAIAPERRGQGVARHLMERAIAEMRDAGTPISALYPATEYLYHRSGYGRAGARYHTRAPIAAFNPRAQGLTPRRLDADDQDAVDALYTRVATARNGHIQRTSYLWDNLRTTRNPHPPLHGYGFFDDDGALQGYLYLVQTKRDDGLYNLSITDHAFATAEAGRGIVRFIAGHRTLAREVRWFGTLDTPLLALLHTQTPKVKLQDVWMLRVLDVRAALEARSWPKHLTASLHLEVHDPMIEANSGRWTLDIDRGKPTVRGGGRGDLRLSIQALASLYTGFYTPEHLVALGASCDRPDAAQLARLLFCNAPAAMPDMF